MMNDTTKLRHQNWMWALRSEMGWPTFKPVNDCIAWASGRLMDIELGMDLARLATLPVEACIVGRALYEGRFRLNEARERAGDRSTAP